MATPPLDEGRPATREEIVRRVAEVPAWYHVLDLGRGVLTPGYFDLRPVLPRLPFPEVRGRRCLDIGTYDGFFAFEMERRGAAEVVATDIPDHDSWDWPVHLRWDAGRRLALVAGPEKGAGFAVARELLGSKVERRIVTIYDLSPDTVGTFDVVVCGSLLLHLRDPLRALEAVRSVCRGLFLSMETIDLLTTFVGRHRPLLRLYGTDELCLWHIPNVAGHRRMLEAAGFEVLEQSRPYTIPYGPAHPPLDRSVRTRLAVTVQRLVAGPPGVPHVAALARPR